MAIDDVVAATQRLTVSVEALAALTTLLRIEGEGLSADESIRTLLEQVVSELGLDLSDLTPEQKQVAAATARTFIRQAAAMIESPSNAPGWTETDPVVLQTLGRTSGLIAPLFRRIAPQLGDLLTTLDTPGARCLDLGTGVGWLAIELARVFPTLLVVGVDVWETSLELARANIAATNLADRVTVRHQDATTVDEPDGYDLIWVPGPFLPGAIVPAVLTAAVRSLRPQGWVIFGLYAGPPDPLAATLTDLRVVRSGGHSWSTTDAADLLRTAGLVDVAIPERQWPAPAVFAAGRRPD